MLFVLLVWDMHGGPGISEFLGQSKVDDIDDRG
jgi:hypothetical protein